MIQYAGRFGRKRPRALAVSTYPVHKPKDGGQIRAAAEREALRAAGFDVTNLVLSTDQWPQLEREPGGFCRSTADLSQSGYPWVCWDLALGRLHRTDNALLAELKHFCTNAKPDVVVLDQPWLWPLCVDLLPQVPLLYSSQNIEYRLKEVNLRIINSPEAEVSRWSDEVQELELMALKNANMSIAVSQSDAEWMTQWTGHPVAVAPNGTHRRTSRPGDQRNWSRHLNYRRSAVFIASGHPPNSVGFWEMLAPDLSFLDPEHVVVALGSIGPSLISHPRYLRHRAVNNARLVVGGYQPDSNVSAIMDISHAVILPITSGEGSNLKTAEALLSHKLVLGTSKAFRGFEAFRGLPGIVIADDRQDFRIALKSTLEHPLQEYHRPEAEELLWTNTLKPLVLGARQLVGL